MKERRRIVLGVEDEGIRKRRPLGAGKSEGAGWRSMKDAGDWDGYVDAF